jgi:hypothetical protein
MAVTPVTGNKVKTLAMPYKVLVLRADPEYEANRTKEPLYEFSARTFVGDNSRLGPYSKTPNIR